VSPVTVTHHRRPGYRLAVVEPSSREVQRRQSSRALQAAAIDLVGRHGLAAVTVDDVAAAAGVSRRTFFNHFPTKAAALFDPDPEDAERLAALLAATPRPGALWPALREVCLTFAAGHEAVLPVRRRLVAEFPELDAYHRTAHRHVEQALGSWARHQCPADPFAAGLAAEAAGAVLVAAFTAWSHEDDPTAFTALVARGFDLVAGGFAEVTGTAAGPVAASSPT
jgi:AcrR family transcriptional regulator